MLKTIKRREFCQFLSSSAVLGLLPSSVLLSNEARSNKNIIFTGGDESRFYIGQYDRIAAPKIVELGYRLHQILPLGGQQYLVISRRPETWMAWVDFDSQTITRVHEVESGYHLYGHACIDEANNILLTAENDTVAQQGYVVLRDLDSMQILERYPSYELGPHQLLFDSKNQRVWVANGGFLLEPESGRAIRNRSDFQSSLVVLDYANGEKIASVQHPDTQQSIRHLALLDNDTVVIGLQHHGSENPTHFAPYAAWQLDQAIQTFVNEDLKQNYVTSIMAVDPYRFAVSMEKDHQVGVVDIRSGQYESQKLDTPQGLALVDNDIYISSRKGTLSICSALNFADSEAQPLMSLPSGFWFDNHFVLS